VLHYCSLFGFTYDGTYFKAPSFHREAKWLSGWRIEAGLRIDTGSALVKSMDGSNQPNQLCGEFLAVLKQRGLISDIPFNPGSRSEFCRDDCYHHPEF
jgi:hypothetical protein